jgi:hypothetical protein
MMKAREILTDESRWTKNVSALDANRNQVEPYHSSAVCFCLFGAVSHAYWYMGPIMRIQKLEVLARTIRVLHPDKFDGESAGLRVITRFNDDPATTFEDVRKVLEAANV